ncbi:MAG: hypothetical protein Q7K45_04235 [Nanoarchaeota archaeon]|nr:hypothetical protein [Nanoarchaeota archaeon]
MKKSQFAVLLGVFLLLLTLFTAADVDTEIDCADDLDCEDFVELGADLYCNADTSTCFQIEEDVDAAPPLQTTTISPPPAGTIEQRVAVLEASLTIVRNDLAAINIDTRDIGGTRADLNNLQRQVAQISNDITTISSEMSLLRTDLSPQVGQALAGFAVLQNNLNTTQMQLNEVEQGLAKERAFTTFLTYTFFILLAIAAMLGVAYYLLRSARNIDPEIVDYITKHIKQGKKYPDIKKELMKAGWGEEDISWAYKETMKQNYQSYVQRKSASSLSSASSSVSSSSSATPSFTSSKTETAAQSRTSPAIGKDKNKMISIAAVTIFLLIGLFFLLSGVVGKAVFVERFINTSSGELKDVVSCTPPQILTPDEDTCCTDANNNAVCDTTEREVELSSDACTDNLQCGSGKLCINGQCSVLDDIYHGSEICDKKCNYYALRVVTSDGETYNVKPKRGSYTAVGALEWKIMTAPEHCNGEQTVIPVAIIRKAPGKILSEEVITLHKGEASPTLTHPNLPDLSFSLKIENVNELCS